MPPKRPDSPRPSDGAVRRLLSRIYSCVKCTWKKLSYCRDLLLAPSVKNPLPPMGSFWRLDKSHLIARNDARGELARFRPDPSRILGNEGFSRTRGPNKSNFHHVPDAAPTNASFHRDHVRSTVENKPARLSATSLKSLEPCRGSFCERSR